MFDLKRPCPNCPFRVSPRFRGLRRADEIAAGLRAGQSFHCHETVDYDSDDEGEGAITSKSQMCAGAMMVLHRDPETTVFTNQMVRIACRFSGGGSIKDPEGFPESHYDFDGVQVYSDLDTFIDNVSD